MNPPQKKTYTKFKKKRKPIDFKKYKKQIIIISSILLAAMILSIGLGIFLNWYFVDTKYDSPFFKSRVILPDINDLGVTKEMVDSEFERQKKLFIRSHSTFEPVNEGVIEKGNNVTVDAIAYFVTDGIVDDTPYSGSKLDDYEITDIGSHVTANGASFFPEVQNALIGKSVVSDTKAYANLTYKDDYSIEELRGKTLQFEITVVSVTKTNSPEITNTFIKEKTGFETVEKYDEELRDLVEREYLWSAIVSKTEIKKYPSKFVNQYIKKIEAYYQNKMESEDLTEAQLLSSLGLSSKEEYEEHKKSEAENIVKEEMVIYRLAKDKKIRVSNKEYKRYLETEGIKNGYSDNEAEYKNDYGTAPKGDLDEFEEACGGKEAILHSMTWEKVKEQLRKDVPPIV